MVGPYFEQLLEQALKCEIPVEQFWQLTPHETFLTIEAYLWRARREQKEQIRAAWLTAALTRSKRLPKLASLLVDPARPLHGRELEERRREYDEMTADIDLETLNKRADNG